MTAYIQRLTENSLLPNMLAFDIVYGILFIGTILLAILFVMKIYKSKKEESFSIVYAASKDYWLNFGWVACWAIILLFLLLVILPHYFHWFLLLFITGAFLLFPLKFIYYLVGGRNSLKGFFVLFIFTQLLFSVLYYSIINEFKQFNQEEKTETALHCADNSAPVNENNENDKKIKADFTQILLNTFYTALIQECAPYYEKFIEDKSHAELHTKFFVILNIQIFISWLYLGVLIASLYQKISKR